jgi:hypothetical protein
MFGTSTSGIDDEHQALQNPTLRTNGPQPAVNQDSWKLTMNPSPQGQRPATIPAWGNVPGFAGNPIPKGLKARPTQLSPDCNSEPDSDGVYGNLNLNSRLHLPNTWAIPYLNQGKLGFKARFEMGDGCR